MLLGGAPAQEINRRFCGNWIKRMNLKYNGQNDRRFIFQSKAVAFLVLRLSVLER